MSSGCQLTQGKHLQFLKPKASMALARPKWRLIHVNLGAPIMKKNLANKICAEAVEQHALVTSQVCSAQLSSPALPALASPNHLMHLTKDGHQDHQSNGSHNYMPHTLAEMVVVE